MLPDLVNGFFGLLKNKRMRSTAVEPQQPFDDEAKLPLQLTEEQKRRVETGWNKFIERNGWVGAQTAKRKYFGVVRQLLASKGGYEAFYRWYKAAQWLEIGECEHPYLQASQEILQVTSVDVLLRYGDLVKSVESHTSALSLLDRQLISFVSKNALEVIATTHSPQIFDLWANLLLRSAENSNGTPHWKRLEIAKYLEQTDFMIRRFSSSPGTLEKLLATAASLSDGGVKPQSFFEACEYACKRLDLQEFARWLSDGLQLCKNPAAGVLAVQEYTPGVKLEDAAHILHLYALALAGKEFSLEPMGGHKNVLTLPHTDGATIWLPSMLSGFGLRKDNMRAYAVFTACQAAKIEFGTFSLENADVQNLVEQLESKYGTKAQGNEPYQRFFSAFPSPELAQTLFELIEGKRTITLLKEGYKGLSATLDAVIKRQFEMRPLPDGKGGDGLILLEAFAHYLALGNIPSATPARLKKSLNLVYNLALQANTPDAGVINSLEATVACYKHFKPLRSNKEASPISKERQTKDMRKQLQNLENQLSFLESALSPSKTDFMVERGGPFFYPEWDVHGGKYSSASCTVAEISLMPVTNVPPMTISEVIRLRSFAEGFGQNYAGPGPIEKRKREPEGEDINIDAAIEFITDLKASRVSRDPNFYIQQRKRPQGIAAAFLIDASPSALFKLPGGKSVIDAERESLELLVAGLGQVEHTFGIFGFTGLRYSAVRVYVIKHFNDTFDRGRLYALNPVGIGEGDDYKPQHDPETLQGLLENMEFAQRSTIGGGTYTGPAVRHVTHLLTPLLSPKKVMFVLTDSEPTAWKSCSDERYEGQYARADINKAFAEARAKGVRPFAISFGGEQSSLYEMYGRDFAVIHNIAELVQKLPGIYVEITR